jgi:hypothetical protein
VTLSVEVLCAQSARVEDISVAVFAWVLSVARTGVQIEPKVNKLRMLHGVMWMCANNKSDNEKKLGKFPMGWVQFTGVDIMTKTSFIGILCAVVLSGCATVDLRVASTGPSYRDATLIQSDILYQETPQSRSVIVGSQVYAIVNSCSLIKRYRIRTNTDFTSALNLFKNRAHMMGGKWVTVVHHSEVDTIENAYITANQEIVLREATDMGSSRYLTTIVGDIYDCPCNINSCSGR